MFFLWLISDILQKYLLNYLNQIYKRNIQQLTRIVRQIADKSENNVTEETGLEPPPQFL